MSEIVIEKGIPIPKVLGLGGNHREARYPLRVMEVGDSFLIKPEEGVTQRTASNRASACIHNAQKATGYKFCKRTRPEGIRVWRIK